MVMSKSQKNLNWDISRGGENSFADFALISPLNFIKKLKIFYGESDKNASFK
jgi:hypothetical protein